MINTTCCTIQLLNKTYDIKCPDEHRNNLLLAAKTLNDALLKKKREFKRLDDYQALLMAALDISHELIICKHQQQEQRAQLSEFINTLEPIIKMKQS